MNSFKMPNGVHHIPLELPWSTPGNVNVYLLEENDGYVMIDCGVDGSEYLKLLEMHLNQLGITFNDIKLLVGTHMHIDHIGLSQRLREFDIPFALYKNSIDYLDEYNDWSIRFKDLIRMAKNEYTPVSFIDDLKSISTPLYAGRLEKPDILLSEGRVKSIKRNLNVVFTPGHDYSEISLYDEKTKIVFSGDHILPRITPFIPVQNENSNLLKEFLDSLDKVDHLDHEIIAPGHGNIISNPHKRIEQMKLHHQRRSERILGFLKNEDLTGWEISNKLFPRDLDSLNLRLAFQETLAHLHLLKSQRRVEKNNKNGVNKWTLIN
ncbi:MAG: MBL fold metallo-hydrolase [Candidatus Actinomarina sp.]|nr:MBL fold metallo-hydrolase [Actinomycetota bacterium]MBL6833294.1 MBL fold metallo-hydrolase [Candidatus Actinomarina sp.]MBL6836954.1 MBL fold metallo-hydrolase [Candidatus Actinomarina sp.]